MYLFAAQLHGTWWWASTFTGLHSPLPGSCPRWHRHRTRRSTRSTRTQDAKGQSSIWVVNSVSFCVHKVEQLHVAGIPRRRLDLSIRRLSWFAPCPYYIPAPVGLASCGCFVRGIRAAAAAAAATPTNAVTTTCGKSRHRGGSLVVFVHSAVCATGWGTVAWVRNARTVQYGVGFPWELLPPFSPPFPLIYSIHKSLLTMVITVVNICHYCCLGGRI